MVGKAPVLLTLRFSSPKMFSIMFKSGDLGGKPTTFTLLHSDMQWWPLPDGLEQHRAATAVSQQRNGLRIEHFVLIASCS